MSEPPTGQLPPQPSRTVTRTRSSHLYARTGLRQYAGTVLTVVIGTLGLALTWSVSGAWTQPVSVFLTSVLAGVFASRISSIDSCLYGGVSKSVLALLLPVVAVAQLFPLWLVGVMVGGVVSSDHPRRITGPAVDTAVSGGVFVAVLAGTFRALSGSVARSSVAFLNPSWLWAATVAILALVAVRLGLSLVRMRIHLGASARQTLLALSWPRLLLLAGLTLAASTLGGMLSLSLTAAFHRPVEPIWQEAVAVFVALSAFGVVGLIQTTASHRRAAAQTRALGESFNGLSQPQIEDRILSWTQQAMPTFTARLVPATSIREAHADNTLTSQPVLSSHTSFSIQVERTSLQRPFSPADSEALGTLRTLAEEKLQTMQTVTRLSDEANTDPLTGLLNYRGFRRAARSVDQARALHGASDSSITAVIFMDLDGFKNVNDTHGHSAGNAVLREVATRISAQTRHPDVAARIGGDEFVVILRSVPDAARAKQIVATLTDAIQAPIRLAEGWVTVGVSSGTAFSTELSTNNASIVDLLAAADQHMYHAKRQKRIRSQSAGSEETPVHTDSSERTAAILDMVRDKRLRVFYQPIVDSSNGAIEAVEALVRPGSDGPNCSASELVQVARTHGLMKPLTQFVLETATADFPTLTARSRTLRELFVNINAGQVLMPTFLHDYGRWKERLPDNALVLEINERWVIQWNPTIAERMCREISNYQLRLALDDFGHSDTALLALLSLPLDVVKVDKSLIDAYRSPRAAVVISGITAMAQTMGIRLVFEGVETTEQLSFLRAHGGRLVQGFVYSQPMPRPALEELLAGPPLQARSFRQPTEESSPPGP